MPLETLCYTNERLAKTNRCILIYIRTHVCVSACRMAIAHMYQRFFLRFLILHRAFTIPIKFLTENVKPLHSLVCVCVCMCMCMCVCACTCTCTSKDAERKCICCAAKTTSYRPSPCSSSRFPVLFCHLSACMLHIYMPTRNVKYICLKKSGWGYSSK